MRFWLVVAILWLWMTLTFWAVLPLRADEVFTAPRTDVHIIDHLRAARSWQPAPPHPVPRLGWLKRAAVYILNHSADIVEAVWIGTNF